jgi:hypothetical protein
VKKKKKERRFRFRIKHYHAVVFVVFGKDLAEACEALPYFIEKPSLKSTDAARSGCTVDGYSYIALVDKRFSLDELNHEISHVADYIFDYIDEDNPGTECRAYLIQGITEGVIKALNQFQLKPTF